IATGGPWPGRRPAPRGTRPASTPAGRRRPAVGPGRSCSGGPTRPARPTSYPDVIYPDMKCQLQLHLNYRTEPIRPELDIWRDLAAFCVFGAFSAFRGFAVVWVLGAFSGLDAPCRGSQTF